MECDGAPIDARYISFTWGGILSRKTWCSLVLTGASFMNEVIFVVEDSPEGGYSARALGLSIFTEADDWQELQANVRDAVLCHFEEGQAPRVVRLHFVREEVIAL